MTYDIEDNEIHTGRIGEQETFTIHVPEGDPTVTVRSTRQTTLDEFGGGVE